MFLHKTSIADGPYKKKKLYILCFQSDVMQVTDDSTKLKLFMDVLDGTKAAVSHRAIPYVWYFSELYCCFTYQLFLSLSADYTHVRALSSSWIHDGHSTTRPPQTVEKVCVHAFDSFDSYQVLSLRQQCIPLSQIDPVTVLFCLQCGSNSPRHPVSPVPDPGECPASWPADDGEDQSQNLVCANFCATDSGTQW